jgi:membrane protein DedA with SNARE-associated domain
MNLDSLGQMVVSADGITSAGLAVIISALIAQLLKELGIPSPGVTQSALIFAGYQWTIGNYLISAGIILAILCGSLCGAGISYSLGCFIGFRFVKRFGKYLHLTQEKLEWIKTKIGSSALLSIFIGRFIPAFMAPSSITAGIIRFPILKYLAGVALAVMMWASLFVGIGILGGQVINSIQIPGIKNIIPVILLAVLGLLLAWIVVRRLIEHRKKLSINQVIELE